MIMQNNFAKCEYLSDKSFLKNSISFTPDIIYND
eukprot:UN20435